jgi:DinB superfamily
MKLLTSIHADATRDELVFQLRHGDAHLSFLDVVADFPLDAINVRPPNTSYSFWHLVEHVRYCQFDMLDYLRNSQYQAGVFPNDYWPSSDAEASEQQWLDSVQAFRSDLDHVESFVMDHDRDLWAAAEHAWEPKHTPLRTVMVMIDHNAFHGGEIGVLRQVMSLWPKDRIDTFTVQAIETQNMST